jgi:mRNA interferase RelE/StbE
MASYELKIRRDAEKEILALPKADRRRIIKKISELSVEPRLHGAEKLRGEDGYRVRQGNYRIVYLINDQDKIIHIIKIGHRREVYR